MTAPAKATSSLPHVMLSSRKVRRERTSSAREKFWTLAGKTCDDRLTEHPLLKGPGWKHETVLLFVHGGVALFQSRDSLMLWSFGSRALLFAQPLNDGVLLQVLLRCSDSGGHYEVGVM